MILSQEELDYRQKIVAKYAGVLTAESNSNLPEYTGPFIVIPFPYQDQILRTAGKHIPQNILVKEVPYKETENISGGRTALIASDEDPNPPTTQNTIFIPENIAGEQLLKDDGTLQIFYEGKEPIFYIDADGNLFVDYDGDNWEAVLDALGNLLINQ